MRKKMNEVRLPDSEVKVMLFLWEHDMSSARETARHMEREYGWKRNTTYTVLKHLQEKGVIERKEPGFYCVPLVKREQIGNTEVKNLIDSFYHGSAAKLFSSFLNDSILSEKDLEEIRAMIDK